MTTRQQRKNTKPKPNPIKKLKLKEDNTPYLERLSGIMKGILVYKTETAELYRLMNKYPEIGYRGAQALGAYA